MVENEKDMEAMGDWTKDLGWEEAVEEEKEEKEEEKQQ